MNRLSLTYTMPAASSHNSHPPESPDPGPQARGCADAALSQHAHAHDNFHRIDPARTFVSLSHTMLGSKYGLHMKRRLFPIRSKLYLSSVRRFPSSKPGSINSIRENVAVPLVFPGKCIG
jgi:hypothetical protein